MTNVPGPSVPLYADRARMLEAFPVVPLAADLAVGVAVLPYDGAPARAVAAPGGSPRGAVTLDPHHTDGRP